MRFLRPTRTKSLILVSFSLVSQPNVAPHQARQHYSNWLTAGGRPSEIGCLSGEMDTSSGRPGKTAGLKFQSFSDTLALGFFSHVRHQLMLHANAGGNLKIPEDFQSERKKGITWAQVAEASDLDSDRCARVEVLALAKEEDGKMDSWERACLGKPEERATA